MTRYVARIGATRSGGAIRPRQRSAYEPPPLAPVDGLGIALKPAALVEPASSAAPPDADPLDPSAPLPVQPPARADVPEPPRSSPALEGADREPRRRDVGDAGASPPPPPVVAPAIPAPAQPAIAALPDGAGRRARTEATDRLAAPFASAAPDQSQHASAAVPPLASAAPPAAGVGSPSAAAPAVTGPTLPHASRLATPSRDLPTTRFIDSARLGEGPLADINPAARLASPATPPVQAPKAAPAPTALPPPVEQRQPLPGTRRDLLARLRGDPDPAPTHVTVSIDRVEIRAPAAEPAAGPRQERQARRRPQTLEEYMRSRPDGRIA